MYCTIIKRAVTALAVITLAGAWSGCSRENGTRIVVRGSTTMFPIVQKAMEEYRKSRKVAMTIEGSGSGNGIRALIEGTADICTSSRKMNEQEIGQAKSAGVDVEEILCARDMIIPVVHPSSRVKNVTMAQLRGIYDGSITSWKQLGGPDDKIAAVTRDAGSGTRDSWYDGIMTKAVAKADMQVHASNGAVVSAVAGNPGAIGYISFGYRNDTVRPLGVENVMPSIETGKARAYPLTRGLYMYVNRVNISGEARAFVNFILGSEGQKIVTRAGYIPL